jgi:hypothetical protein
VIGAAAAVYVPSGAGRLTRRALLAALFALACYSIACLRLSYFKEWRFNADSKRIYDVLAYYNHTYGVEDVATNFRFTSSLNFYRRLSERETFPEFVPAQVDSPYPEDKPIYVLYFPFDAGFADAHKLKIVYHGEESEAVVAIRPGIEQAARSHRSPAPGAGDL